MILYPYFIDNKLNIRPNESLKYRITINDNKLTSILHRFYGDTPMAYATEEEQKLYNKYMKLKRI